MDWHCLGHAMWLAEVSGLRLLFDPLLDDLHHGGVFEVFPPRKIHADALRPDFVFVSHRHPDHFDVPSLARLAKADPDTVVVTSDPLVADTARALGFRTVRRIDAGTHVTLDGAELVTTPSAGALDPEWGVLVATEDGAVYNQIDTALDDPRTFLQRAATTLGRDADGMITLHLARWQPLLEVEAALAGSIGFPFRAYRNELEHCAAIGARAVCPASAGTRHAGAFGAWNRLVYPVTEARFLEDARARMPNTRLFAHVTGATYRVRSGEACLIDGGAMGAGLVSVVDGGGKHARDPRDFDPLAIPPLSDPCLDADDEDTLRQRVDAWVHGALAQALERVAPAQGTLRHLLVVVFASKADAYTICVEGGATPIVRVVRDEHPAWDLRCAVAGSLLVDVIEGRRHWGDLLLGGMLRAESRAYTVDRGGLVEAAIQPLFVYHAISYDESVRRAVAHAVSRALKDA